MQPFTTRMRARPALLTDWKAGLLGLLSFLVSNALLAQDAQVNQTSLESDIRFAMIGNSSFKERSTTGSLDGYDFGTRDVLSVKVREGFLLRFGLDLERSNFSVSESAALPSKLQTAAAVIGADLQLGDAWIVRLEVDPGYYGAATELREKNFDVPITFGASYFVSSDLQLVAGISIDPQRKYVVLPGAGFRYKFATDWVMDLVLPTPRLEYTYSKSLLLYAGGELEDGSYRTDGNFGTVHDLPKLNDAVVDYTEIRVGGGASWKINSELTLEFEAGVVPLQEFDFHRAEIKARSTDIPPYGGLVLKAAF